MNRWLMVALAATGPLCVGLLRFLLPYYTTSDNEAAASAVASDPGAQSLLLWLGAAAALTLVPGLYLLREHLPPGRLRTAGVSLAMIGYLCVPALLSIDLVHWLGATQDVPPATTAQLLDGLHPSITIQIGVFVPTHILGLVLIGTLALRARLVPQLVAWALIVSQPLHLASVILGLPTLDLVAWSMTALGSAWIAATVTSGARETSRPKPTATPVPA